MIRTATPERAAVLRRPGWPPAIALLWAGMLIGVSAIATPVKFLAPSLTLPVALDVGRQTFAMFGKIEIVLLAVLALAVGFGERRQPDVIALALLAVLLACETLWLLPVLDAGITAIISGGSAPPGPEHVLYIVAEVLKLLALAAIVLAPRRSEHR